MHYRLTADQMKALLSVQYQLQLVHQLMDQAPSQPQVSFSDVDAFIEAQAAALARVLDHVDPTYESRPADPPAAATKAPPGRKRERLTRSALQA